MTPAAQIAARVETPRVAALRRRVRDAMELPAVPWEGPGRIAGDLMSQPLPVRKAHAIALKLSAADRTSTSRARIRLP